MDDLSSKEFLKEIEELTAALITDIEAAKRGLDPSPEAKRERRRRVLSGDFQFFTYTYFPHHMWLEDGQKPSVFQQHYFDFLFDALTMESGWANIFVAPRGEGKSTLGVKVSPLFVCVLALLQDESVRAELQLSKPACFIDYIILFGAEASMPAKSLEVVKTELLHNENLQLDFPEICGGGAVWKIGEFTTPQNVKFESKGANQAVRGAFHGASRPRLLMIDDIITDAEAKSDTERNSRWQWLLDSVENLGPPDGSVKLLGVNTILHSDDPISRAKKEPGYVVHVFKALIKKPVNMDLWSKLAEKLKVDDNEAALKAAPRILREDEKPSYQFYLKNKRAMDAGAKTSWPSVRSLYRLMVRYLRNPRSFNREMQGIPRSTDEQLFTNIQFWVNRLNDFVAFGACDPSMGKTEKADPSALLVGFRSRNTGILHVEAESRKRRPPSKLRRDMSRLQAEYNCQTWAFENNNAYEYMRTDMIEKSLTQDNVALPLRGVTAVLPQFERIESLETYINNNPAQIVFNSSLTLLLDELSEFPEKPPEHHFDLCCALSLLWMVSSTSGRMPRVRSKRR